VLTTYSDDEDCLTPLGWWGLPEAMRYAYTHGYAEPPGGS
jgi:hypothetical protein